MATKKIFFIALFFVFSCSFAWAQQGNISVRGITCKGNGTYKPSFRDNSNEYLSDYNSSQFTYYLSYKGKRVSDYFYENSGGSRDFYRYVKAWPGEIPAGHEGYVTVQLGKEPEPKDPRDDD